jgi:2-haloacid dehalogenase
MLGDEIPGTREITKALRDSGTPIYALTNWNAQTWELGVTEFPFLAEVFDGIVVSGQEGVTKPDPRIFEILSTRYNLEPSTTAFIDDSPKNVAAATTLGYQAHLFTNAPELETWLRELDVL